MECRVRDLTVHYEEVGTGRLLLGLHGAPLDHRHIYADLEPIFSRREGWRRVYPDLPGMGKTRTAAWMTHQDHVLDVMSDFVNAIAPEEQFAVAGTSYGGYLARGMVYRHGARVIGLMMNVPVVETDPKKRNLPPRQVLRQDPEFLAALTPAERESIDVIVVQSMELLEIHRAVIAPAVSIADHGFLNRLYENFTFSFDINSLPIPFPAPTLILAGRQDIWCGYREAWQILDDYPRATFAVLDRAGHVLAIEQKTLFRSLVSEWLNRVEDYIRQ